MRQFFSTFNRAVVTLLLAAGLATAAPITYTTTGRVSGELDGTPFTNELLTITAVGDTSTVTSGSVNVLGAYNFEYFTNTVPATFQLGTQSGSFITRLPGFFGPLSVRVPLDWPIPPPAPGANIIGIGEQDGSGTATSPLFVTAPSPNFYDLSSNFTFTGPGETSDALMSYFTSLGGLMITSVDSPTVTFTASTATAVPEIDPAGMGSVLALAIGGLGLIERRRLARKTA